MTETHAFTPSIVPPGTAGWIERLARAGYAAKGVVYLLVGVFAGQAAFGSGDAEGSLGALRALADEPLGRAFLGVIAAGLLGHVVWRAVAAWKDPERRGGATRVFFAVSALVYAALAVESARLALGLGGGESGGHWSGVVARQPYGLALLGVGGAIVAAYGVYRLYQAWVVDLDDRLDLSRLGPTAAFWVVLLGRLGYAARGAVFTLLGGLAVRAAAAARPEQVRPLGGLLEDLESHPWILGVIAAGFIAYALYEFVRAGYRRIGTPRPSAF